MNFDFDMLIRAVAVLIEAVIVAVLIPWAKGRIEARKFEKIQAWVTAAVAAAEKLYWTDSAGVDKKAWVLEFLANKGIEIDAESLDVLVEAAVYNLPKYLDAVSVEAVMEAQSTDEDAPEE